MFTGLIQDVGTVVERASGDLLELRIRTALGAGSFELGESIAIDGCCLTVVEKSEDAFRVQASEETLRRTTLGALTTGARVNLERALAFGARLGGHLVQGHVDGVAEILETHPEGGAKVMRVGLPKPLARYFVEKGSVAMDGVSLTVNRVEPDAFSVTLIPETLERTTLGGKGVGAKVNLEADLIGKYVARQMEVRGT